MLDMIDILEFLEDQKTKKAPEVIHLNYMVLENQEIEIHTEFISGEEWKTGIYNLYLEDPIRLVETVEGHLIMDDFEHYGTLEFSGIKPLLDYLKQELVF